MFACFRSVWVTIANFTAGGADSASSSLAFPGKWQGKVFLAVARQSEHTPARNEGGHGDRIMPVRINVAPALKELIETGDNMIGDAKWGIFDETSNQSSDRSRSKGNNIFSGAAMGAARTHAFGQDARLRPIRSAYAALAFETGNCQETAAVAYAMGREIGGLER